MGAGIDPISDDELLYRRVPASASPTWYDPSTGELSAQAFAPHKTQDKTGLSVFRAKHKSIEDAAKGRPGKVYYVAKLRVRDVWQAGIAVVPQPITPDGYDHAHAELPDLNAGNRKSGETLERQRVLVELCLEVAGPFPAQEEVRARDGGD